MIKIHALVAALAALALLLVACGSDTSPTVTGSEDTAMDDEASDTSTTAVLDDGDGGNDEIAEDAADEVRIISLNPTATEMLFAVGAGDLVVAVDAFSYYPPEAPVTDLSGYEPNIEAIAGFEPTLVVSEAPIEGLDAVGIENLVLAAAVTIDDVYAQIEQVGALTGRIGEAAELVGQMRTDIDAVLAGLPDRETPLTYYHELDNTLYSVTSSTFIGEVYRMLGLENVADPADADGSAFGYPQLSEEFLVTADPDLIFLADTLCCEQTAETVAARPGWEQMSAVTNGNVIELNDDIVSRWGPRIVEFIQTAGAAVAAIDAVPAS